MSREWEQYKNPYTERLETFNAYADVWTRVVDAHLHFSGWAIFSQCANAEPSQS